MPGWISGQWTGMVGYIWNTWSKAGTTWPSKGQAILILNEHEYRLTWQMLSSRRSRWGQGLGGDGSRPLGRQLNGALLLAVSSVSTDLHEVLANRVHSHRGNCKLQKQWMENGQQAIFTPKALKPAWPFLLKQVIPVGCKGNQIFFLESELWNAALNW